MEDHDAAPRRRADACRRPGPAEARRMPADAGRATAAAAEPVVPRPGRGAGALGRALGLAALAGMLACGTAGAAPAPWYQWRSLLDGRTACAQTSPGAGWAQSGGPYRDAGCSQPLRVIRL